MFLLGNGVSQLFFIDERLVVSVVGIRFEVERNRVLVLAFSD
jgi:hypothetical protein